MKITTGSGAFNNALSAFMNCRRCALDKEGWTHMDERREWAERARKWIKVMKVHGFVEIQNAQLGEV